MPDFAFPTVGRLGITSPPYRMPTPRLSSVLRSAKTAKSPSHGTSLREAVVPWYLACTRLFVSLPIYIYRGSVRYSAQVQWHHYARSLDKPVHLSFRLSCKETVGSPEFPGYPCEYMPRSQTPVVVSCMLVFNAYRTAAFQRIQTVGFHPDSHRDYPNVHDYTNFGAQ